RTSASTIAGATASLTRCASTRSNWSHSRRTSSCPIPAQPQRHCCRQPIPSRSCCVVADPVGAGYVESLARPGGNATGFTPFEYSVAGKWLELLKEIAPRVTRAAVLRDSSIAAGPGFFGAIQSTASSLGIALRPVDVRDAAEIERSITVFAQGSNAGLVVTG